MNAVETKKQQIIEAAAKAGVGVRFTQTNHGNHACTSRVYLFPVNEIPSDVRSKCVIKSWSFKQAQDAGTTERCERYRIYSQVLKFLENEQPL